MRHAIAQSCRTERTNSANRRVALSPTLVKPTLAAGAARSGEVVLLDVRPRVEFDAGHIEGARSIPLDQLEDRLVELPPGREVVAYCRGPFCAYAHEAVRRPQTAGHPALRLQLGWPEWRLAGRAGAESSTTKNRRRAA